MVDLIKYTRKGLADAPSNPILKFSDYASKIPDVVKFTLGEPDFNTPDHIKNAAKKGIDENHSHYAPSNGTIGLRKAAADFLAQKYGQKYDPETEVLVTNGVTESIFDTVCACLNSGDIMVVPTPIFPLYMSDVNILNDGAKIVTIDTSKDGFKLTPAKLQAILDEYGDKVRMLVMNYPTNPTGVMYSQEELDAIADVIRDKPIFALCDEIYSELNYDQPHASMEKSLHDQVVLMNGVSKAWAMTGYRIGIVCAPQAILEQIAKVHQTIVTTEPTPMQDAAEEAFKNGMNDSEPMKREFQKRRDVLYQGLTDIGFECAKPQGAFYIFAKIPAGLEQDDSKFIYDLVDKAHVAVTAGSSFALGGQGYIRFSYAVSMDQINEGLRRIKKYVEENK
ncbi:MULTISPECIES: aminotransferase class I/II-fold pyridoxal phosphate-dependent enzyme [unclassified Lactobacillus]|uniref:aminotransferase class I/II-fold pyridoxal phosphate-dependent enzyme n=1 Tax=unclassified Lactobacillus TaxID=2620435 RepID=UPI00226AC346|nr:MULTISPECIES: aminotransferase class I/II-fold pyridoxal phosphate-dependent enzyme [unclassified Lactobacillus]MCX8720952.1 aminotransferase class I/II-fold pyridoxal phosphate-dependent enzyme [Lactobacillus sp. B4010]MCX8733099.1 aminotransferase class I/II-fold pyridoxal phosphate-dependent enzyme [Lactobacillus sp. B4015]MCX8735181.1 aminotransferase class I/II-fold pyridoxal phosphate-dependent enzyme [Lactobacillus sp. B4012]